MIVSIMRQLFVLIPAAYILAKLGGLHVVWWSFPIAEVISLMVSPSSWYGSTGRSFQGSRGKTLVELCSDSSSDSEKRRFSRVDSDPRKSSFYFNFILHKSLYGFVLASPISAASPANGANWFCITANASRISAWFSLFPVLYAGTRKMAGICSEPGHPPGILILRNRL